MSEERIEIVFPSAKFTREEIEQGLDTLLGKGAYQITEHKHKPFEDDELGYSTDVDAFVVSVLSGIVANVLAALLQEFIKSKRNEK